MPSTGSLSRKLLWPELGYPKSGVSSGPLMWVAEAQELRPAHTVLPGTLTGIWILKWKWDINCIDCVFSL